MNHQDIKYTLQKIGEECSQKIGYELVELIYNKKKEPSELEFIVYHVDGVKIDDCVSISQEISRRLDEIDLIREAYELSVSSPGIDRPIKTEDDFRRNKGKLLEAHLYTLLDGKKDFEGILVDFDEQKITLKLDNNDEIDIPKKSLSLLRQVIVF